MTNNLYEENNDQYQPTLNALLPRISKTWPYSLRSLTAEERDIHFFRDKRNCNLKRTEEFFMFRYFL